MRKQKSDIPKGPIECPKERCVYNTDGVCDEPRINKGNSDSLCFRMSNKYVIEMLIKAREEQQARDAEVNKYFDMVLDLNDGFRN